MTRKTAQRPFLIKERKMKESLRDQIIAKAGDHSRAGSVSNRRAEIFHNIANDIDQMKYPANEIKQEATLFCQPTDSQVLKRREQELGSIQHWTAAVESMVTHPSYYTCTSALVRLSKATANKEGMHELKELTTFRCVAANVIPRAMELSKDIGTEYLIDMTSAIARSGIHDTLNAEEWHKFLSETMPIVADNLRKACDGTLELRRNNSHAYNHLGIYEATTTQIKLLNDAETIYKHAEEIEVPISDEEKKALTNAQAKYDEWWEENMQTHRYSVIYRNYTENLAAKYILDQRQIESIAQTFRTILSKYSPKEEGHGIDEKHNSLISHIQESRRMLKTRDPIAIIEHNRQLVTDLNFPAYKTDIHNKEVIDYEPRRITVLDGCLAVIEAAAQTYSQLMRTQVSAIALASCGQAYNQCQKVRSVHFHISARPSNQYRNKNNSPKLAKAAMLDAALIVDSIPLDIIGQDITEYLLKWDTEEHQAIDEFNN